MSMSTSPAFSLCVYCGSRPGTRPAYTALARRLGQAIGQRGWQLVYGGGRAGLMGVVADAALASGARVIGVIPDTLMRLEVGHQGLTELHVVRTMHERKHMMAERSDAFVDLPGGIGTFEEFFEVWTWRQLGYHDRPIGLLDAEGNWSPMVSFLNRSCDEGFMDTKQMSMLTVDAEVDRLLDALYARRGTPRLTSLERI